MFVGIKFSREATASPWRSQDNSFRMGTTGTANEGRTVSSGPRNRKDMMGLLHMRRTGESTPTKDAAHWQNSVGCGMPSPARISLIFVARLPTYLPTYLVYSSIPWYSSGWIPSSPTMACARRSSSCSRVRSRKRLSCSICKVRCSCTRLCSSCFRLSRLRRE